jgi:hypothetical protein
LWATLYTTKLTLKTSRIILWLHAIFQFMSYNIGALCCRSYYFLNRMKIVCILEISNKVRFNHTHPTWIVSNLKLEWLRIWNLDSNQFEIIHFPKFFFVKCQCLKRNFPWNSGMWRHWCKNNSLKYDVPHYFDVMSMYIVDHTIVHQRVSHTISVPSICTWNNMVFHIPPNTFIQGQTNW